MIAALIVALLAQATPPRDTRPAAETTSSEIAGVVLSDEAQPRPLRRARVTVAGAGAFIPRTVISGDDGTFLVDRLPAGRFTVTAAKEGFITMAHGASRPGRPGTQVSVVAQQSLRIDLRLRRGGVISGTVSDVDGQPAHGVPVRALARRYFSATGEQTYVPAGISAGATDDRGAYRIYGLAPGDYFVASQPTRTTAGFNATEVRMMAGGSPGPTRLVQTQVLHPSATEAARASRVTVRAGEERSGIDIQLQYVPLAVVSGTVAGAGAGPATITLARIDEVPGYDPVRTGRTDADGRFSLGAVPPGQYRMIARAQAPSAGAPAPQAVQYALVDVTVAGEDVTNVAVALQPGLTIAGQIVFDGEAPPASFPVSLRVPIPSAMNIANAGFTMPALQIEGTRFRIDGVIPGSYRLMGTTQGVRSPIGKWWLKSLVVDGRDVLDAPLDLRQSTDGAVATFTDRVASVNGLVTDRQGAAVEGIYVVVLPVDRRAWFYNSRRIAAVRTRDGRYTVQNLPPGDYRLVASADLELNEWFDPEVLERLVQTGTPVTIEGPVAKTLHLQLR